jgi:hypothetical protein
LRFGLAGLHLEQVPSVKILWRQSRQARALALACSIFGESNVMDNAEVVALAFGAVLHRRFKIDVGKEVSVLGPVEDEAGASACWLCEVSVLFRHQQPLPEDHDASKPLRANSFLTGLSGNRFLKVFVCYASGLPVKNIFDSGPGPSLTTQTKHVRKGW